MIKFITGNKGKAKEAQKILNTPVSILNIDLNEIQSVDVEEVIKYKIDEAKKYCSDNFIVEDSGLYLGKEKEIGALIKFIPLNRIVKAYRGEEAEAVCCIGCADGNIFKGSIKGKIVKPKGKNGFGWDVIFQPEGSNKTFAEISVKEKNKISQRRKALEKLARHFF